MYMCLALILSLTVGQNVWGMEEDSQADMKHEQLFIETNKKFKEINVSIIVNSFERMSPEEIEAALSATDNSHNTLLHIAAARGHFGLVSFFLYQGANPAALNNEGRTPLQSLENTLTTVSPQTPEARRGEYEAIKTLLVVAQRPATGETIELENKDGVEEGAAAVASTSGSTIILPKGQHADDTLRKEMEGKLPGDVRKQAKDLREQGKKDSPKQSSGLWKWTKRGALGVALAALGKVAYDNKVTLEKKAKQFAGYLEHKYDEHFGGQKEAARKAAKAA